uniref:DUF229 domain-containing protein n=1 Tax=Fervidobacterium pennivorans TaxID=93466 RepID=A0A7V4KC30_FERPE
MDYPNVVFIVIDTLRKDYAKSLEEELKKLGFISYKNAIAPSSWTLPSHVSMLTGLYPAFHGVHETKTKKDFEIRVDKKKRRALISYIFSDLGLNTYLITANPFVSRYCGIHGFLKTYEITGWFLDMLSDYTTEVLQQIKQQINKDDMGNKFKYRLSIVKELLKLGKYSALLELILKYPLYPLYQYYHRRPWPIDKGAKFAIKKLESILSISRKDSNFIFMNLMEVHEPYSKKEEKTYRNYFMENLKTNKLNPNLIKNWKENYPKEVAYVTERVLEIMRILKERGMFDNSLIIVTSDHGQLLGEHGRIGHGVFLYDELLRVPLLVKYPKGYTINHIQEDSKYISLTRLKPFILDIINKNISDDSILYEDTVFAESYGVHLNVGELSTEEERKNIEQLEKYRVAIYYKNFKGLFNVTDWKFEEVKSYNPKIEVTESVEKHMKKKVVKFLKTATLAKVPKIEI